MGNHTRSGLGIDIAVQIGAAVPSSSSLVSPHNPSLNASVEDFGLVTANVNAAMANQGAAKATINEALSIPAPCIEQV
jgi:hypothetical protein